MEPKESHDVDFIAEKSTHNLDETKTSLFSIDSVLVAEPIMGASTQKRIQGYKSTSTTVLEFDDFTSNRRSGSAEDGVDQIEVSTPITVCKEAIDVRAMLDKDEAKTDSIGIQDSQEKEENSVIENRPELEILKPLQLESRDLNAPT